LEHNNIVGIQELGGRELTGVDNRAAHDKFPLSPLTLPMKNAFDLLELFLHECAAYFCAALFFLLSSIIT
jgi:hypothetical protein